MSNSIIAEGKTSTEAIENGLKQLKVSKDRVDIKILEDEKTTKVNIIAHSKGGLDAKYMIEKQTEHLFWFKNQNGDVIKLQKSDDAEDAEEFVHDTPKIMSYTHQVKTDSVVTFGGDRYHWYIAINPTKYKVVKRSYSDDGLEVDNVYYDNIMHISVYKGANCLYSSDFRKQQYQSKVPADFLEGAILGNMEYSHTDAQGLHFNATLCIPDGASCYLVETLISFKGQMTMKLIEY